MSVLGWYPGVKQRLRDGIGRYGNLVIKILAYRRQEGGMSYVRTTALFFGLAVILVTGCPDPQSRAIALSGNTLHSMCEKNSFECMVYIAAVTDVLDDPALSGSRACVPPGVMMDQTKDVVFSWLEQYPQRRHYNAASLVLAALEEAYPCKK
jgi:hypothetical protein